MTTTIERPANLDPTRLHTPEEVDAWNAANCAYFDAIREYENSERLKEGAAKAKANRIIDRQEYYELSVKREAERQAREAERHAERQAGTDEKATYLASMPDIAEVSERSEFLFLQSVIHWASKGYTLADDGIDTFFSGFYSCRLNKPAAKKAK